MRFFWQAKMNQQQERIIAQQQEELNKTQQRARELFKNLEASQKELAEYKLSQYNPYKEQIETTVATEQYVESLRNQILALQRANRIYQKQISDKIWITLHQQTRAELLELQEKYWKLQAEYFKLLG